MLRIAQWSGFGIYFAVSALSNVRAAQDSQPLRVCRHNSVLHSVVHHLDEMAGAVWAAVQIALLGGAIDLLPANSARNIAHSGCERGKDWIEPLDDLGLAANHHAVTTLQTPHTSACAHIHIVDLSGSEFLCPPDIVHIVRVPTVDEDVSCIEVRQKISDSAVDNRCRNHQPDSSRLCEFLNQLFERGGACRLLLDQFVHSFWRPVEHYAVVTFLDEPPHHVGAHPSKTNHAKLHISLSSVKTIFQASKVLLLWAMLARSRLMAVATPTLSPKIDDPATNTLAPAVLASGAVS